MKKLGLFLTTIPFLIFFIEQQGMVISKAAGKLYCGKSYLQEINGVLTEQSCGFDSDMTLVAFLFVMMLIGVIMLVTARKAH